MFATFATRYGADRQGTLAEAVGWVQGLVLGSFGTTIAVLAVAGFGFVLLQGRFSLRHGIKVVLGCFILFGAPAIASGLATIARWSSPPSVQIAIPPPPVVMPSAPAPDTDSHAGASVQM